MAWTSIETNKAPWVCNPPKEVDPRAIANAKEVYAILNARGWSLDAISGVLGNWSWESFVNPGQWQLNHTIGGSTGGFGLGQWTPPKHVTHWMEKEGHPRTSGYWQVIYLDLNDIWFDGKSWGSQWQTAPAPHWTWERFKKSTDGPRACADAFFQQWEMPGDSTGPKRMEAAEYWYGILSGEEPGPDPGPGPDPEPGPGSLALPLWLHLYLQNKDKRMKRLKEPGRKWTE